MKMVKRISQVIIAFAAVVMMMAVVSVPAKAATVNHNVTFMYGTKTFVEPVAHGATAIAPVDTYVEGYTFIGWVGNLVNVTEDRIILGDYVKNVTTSNPAVYVVNFVDGITGKIISTQTVACGASATAPEPPQHYGYKFTGWSESYCNVTSNRTIYSTYNGYYWWGGLPYYCYYSYYGWNVYPYFWYYDHCYYAPAYRDYYQGTADKINAVNNSIKESYNNKVESFENVSEKMTEAQDSLQQSISDAFAAMPDMLK